jgi:hypothetical protein
MGKTLLKIFVNFPAGARREDKITEAYAQQFQYLRQIWNEDTYGLERIVRLALCLAQFLFPVLLIRDIFGRYGALGRKLAVETYTVLKFIFPLIVLWQGWFRQPFVILLIVYFFSDTFIHILHLIFLSDLHPVAVSYRRSLLLIFLHYAEVAFDFAVIYMAFDLLNRPMDVVTALYFSIVATTTVGFGDITAKNTAGQLVVMSQLLVCVVFIIVFINYFAQKVNEK